MWKKCTLFLLVGVFCLLIPRLGLANSPPSLNNGGAQPSLATVGTKVTYQIIYSDPEGNSPAYVRVCFRSGKYNMTKASGDLKTGAVYQYSSVVKAGEKGSEYYFEASDGKATARHPAEAGSTLSPVNILSEKLDNNQIYFFNREKSTPQWAYPIGSDWVQNVAISANGQYIAVATNKSVYLFSKESNKPLWQYQCFAGPETVESHLGWIALSADGNYIAGSCKNELAFFSKESGAPLWVYPGNLYAVAISSNGEYIALGTMGVDELFLFSKESNQPLWRYQAGGDIHGLAVSADGHYVAAGAHCPDRRAFLFERQNGAKPLVSYALSTGSPVWTAAISADGKYAVYGLDSAGNGKSIFLFSPGQNKPVRSWTTEWWVRSLAMSQDGKYIAAGSGDHYVYLIDKGRDQPLWKFQAGERVGSVGVSRDASYIAAGSKDKKVYLFGRSSNKPVWSYPAASWVNAVAISADGKYLVAGTGASQYLSEGSHSQFNPEVNGVSQIQDNSVPAPVQRLNLKAKLLGGGGAAFILVAMIVGVVMLILRKRK